MTTEQISNERYHADVGSIGKSGLDLIRKSPAHYWAKYLDPNREIKPPTAALSLGTAVHHAILEPDEFDRRYRVLPAINRQTKAGREEFEALMTFAKENRLTFLTEKEREQCKRMGDSVRKHPAAKILLAGGEAEKTIKWTDLETGARCKSRLDWDSDTGYITDVKTTIDASPRGFGRSSIKYRYPVQGALYYDGYEQALKQRPEGFAFITVEKESPYAVGVYYMTKAAFQLGRKLYLEDLRVYKKCVDENYWPAYSDEFMPLDIPDWALRLENQ